MPNLLTTLGLLSGFNAIILASNAKFDYAVMFIFIAMVFDALDGRVARLANAQTDFGAQYDSMSDLISFGVAPALLAYFWGLSHLGNLGWIAALIYVITAALRLARFNTQIGIEDKNYFQGLPSPAAAALVAGMVGTLHALNFQSAVMTWCCLTAAGVLMVSNIRYYSFKGVNVKDRVPFKLVLLAVLVLIVIAFEPILVLFLLFLFYALSGLTMTIIEVKRKKEQKNKISKKEEGSL